MINLVNKLPNGIRRNITRYYEKNTVSARYNRYITRADYFSLLSTLEMFRLPSWSEGDIGIMTLLSTAAMYNYRLARTLSKPLKEIEQRAKNIKNINKKHNILGFRF